MCQQSRAGFLDFADILANSVESVGFCSDHDKILDAENCYGEGAVESRESFEWRGGAYGIRQDIERSPGFPLDTGEVLGHPFQVGCGVANLPIYVGPVFRGR